LKVRSVVCRPSKTRLAIGFIYARLVGQPALLPLGPFRMEEYRQVPLSSGQVRVKCLMGGICGTDLALLNLDLDRKSARFASKKTGNQTHFMGHECVAVVQEVATESAGLHTGQRVVLLPEASCKTTGLQDACEMCNRGLPLLCVGGRYHGAGSSHGGAWSDELVRPASCFMAIPETINDRRAVLIEPFAAALHAVLRRMPQSGQSAVVIGCGIIGLAIIASLRFLGFSGQVVALARYPHQVDAALLAGASDALIGDRDAFDLVARLLGTSVLGQSPNRILLRGADVVYDAVGSEKTIGFALRLAKPRGAVVLEGISGTSKPFDTTPIWLREIDLIGAHGYATETVENQPQHTFHLATQLLASIPQADELVTHVYPLREYKQAINAACSKRDSKAIKVAFDLSLP
jgi:L-iditol 2-dehydrogenase